MKGRLFWRRFSRLLYGPEDWRAGECFYVSGRFADKSVRVLGPFKTHSAASLSLGTAVAVACAVFPTDPKIEIYMWHVEHTPTGFLEGLLNGNLNLQGPWTGEAVSFERS
jgi:hypothetical protein